MFNFYKKNDGLIRNRIELISIHIPKCAGTSFRNILKMVYGDEAVIRLDIDLQFRVLKINEQEFKGRKLNKRVKVVHGHFAYPLLKDRFELEQDVPMITWIRHPVDRVISNYYYLEKRLKEELNEKRKGLNILRKMQRTLMEYAADEYNQNRISKFLQGVELNQFGFVGVQEFYEEDLALMAKQFSWPSYEFLHVNKTGGGYKDQVSEEQRMQIAMWNDQDMAIYKEALAIRNQRV